MKLGTLTAAIISTLAVLALSASPASAIDVGDTPELSFKSIDGKQISLADLKGKLVLVDFWATWCGPCMAEAGHMVQVHEKYGPEGLQIIGISLDQNRTALENVVKQAKFDWPQYFDGKGWENKVSRAWGVQGIPRTFLLDTEGKVVWVGHPAQMDAPIAEAFEKTPPVLVDAETEQAALATLDQVDVALTGGDDARALSSLAAMPSDARKSPQVKQRLAELDSRLQEAANKEFATAETLIRDKKYLDAATTLAYVSDAVPETTVGQQAEARLTGLKEMPEVQNALKMAQLNASAETEYAAAAKLESDGNDEQAYSRYKQITKQFPNTETAQLASAKVTEFEQDPAFVKRANEAAASGKATGMISLAQNYARAGRKDKAKEKYQEVIDQFPETTYAESAKKELAAIK